LKKIAISIGDLNGIGVEIALRSHNEINKLCEPIYCVDKQMIVQASKLLNLSLPDDINFQNIDDTFSITPQKVDAKSGDYSFASFKKALQLVEEKKADAVCTLPIHKEAWSLAGIKYKGHTEYLREFTGEDAIMVLGCENLYVALFTEHIALKDVAQKINTKSLVEFFTLFYEKMKKEKIGVLGLNPHSGDNGVIGKEETIIEEAIKDINSKIGKEVFHGALVPDTAFTPNSLKNYNTLIAMYHDQGLAPLKALYFEESINISINRKIIRTSVDHGTAMDIAYQNASPSTKSYLNAIKAAVKQASA